MLNVAKKIDAFIFIGLLAIIVIAITAYGSVDVWWEALFECGVFVLTAIWLVNVMLRGHWNLKRAYILFPLALITLYVFLQTVPWPGAQVKTLIGLPLSQNTLTIDPYQTRLTAIKTLALTLFTALLLLHTSTPKRFQWLVRVIIGIGLASAAFGILRQLAQPPDATTGFILPFLFPNAGYGQFLSSNVFAFLMEMVYGLVAALVIGGAVPRQLILIYAAIGLIVWAALVLSNSRGGVLGLICQSALIVFVAVSWYLSSRAQERPAGSWYRGPVSVFVRTLGILLIVGSVLAGVLWMGGEQLAGKHSDGRDVENGITRTQIWHSTWQMISQRPWTGVGFGAYFLGIPQYQSGTGKIKLEQAHNDYLDLLASGGIVAFALAALFAAAVMWRARSSLRSSDPYRRAAALGAVAAIVSVAIHSLVDFGLQITGIAVVFSALVVIVIADEVEQPLPGSLAQTKRSRMRLEVDESSRRMNPQLGNGFES